jgi:hypothetical protein
MGRYMEHAVGRTRRQYFRLTAKQVEKEKRAGLHCDGAGLNLLVGRRTGSKSWVFRYRVDGRLRDMGLDPLHTVSLQQAREAARECRELKRNGIDPIEARRTKQQQARLDRAKAMTFEQCAKAYIDCRKAEWTNAKHGSQWPNTFRDYVYPIIGPLPVQAIDIGLVLDVLMQPVDGASDHDEKRLWWRKPETASQVRQRIEAVLDWARHRGYREGENPARWEGNLEYSLPRKTKVRPVKHHAALPYTELPVFFAELRKQIG